MTGGDARGEAERIVDRMELELSWLSDEYDVLRDRLVTALAAAIEVHDCCDGWNLQALREAMTVLRDREVQR